MSTLGDRLRARMASGGSASTADNAPHGKTIPANVPAQVPPAKVEGASLWSTRGNGVKDSEDLQRILALPSRPPAPADPEALVEEYTRRFARPGSNARLRPIQAFALHEAERAAGLLGLIGVGGGKTLLSLLLPTLWGVDRALILVPASLLPKLKHNYEQLLKDWRLQRLVGSDLASPDQTGVIYMASYSALANPKTGPDLLERINPKAIIADEGHKLAGLARSSTRDRFRAHARGAGKPYKNAPRKTNELEYLAILSGTLITRSIKPAAGLGKMILGTKSPLPLDYHELEAWSYALDPSPNPAPPGELVQLCAADETPRQGFRRRVMSTQGVVGTSEDAVENGLEFYERKVEVPKSVQDALAELRKSWTTPTGQRFDLALEFSRYARQLATGLELHWTFPAGETSDQIDYWLEVRAAWNKEVQSFLNTHSRSPKFGMDSPALLEEAAEDGRWASAIWQEWKAVRDTVSPVTQCHWVSDFLVKDAVSWGHESPGIIWVVNTVLGEAIAKEGGFPWYGAGMEEEMLAECSRKKARTIVASMDAHSTGNDMQPWSRMLFTYTSSNSKRWEQAIARSHRPGQLADTVEVHYYSHTLETQKAMAAALLNAEGVAELTGLSQKLLVGTFVKSS